MVPISILDLASVAYESTPAVAFRNSLDLAQKGEAWGYNRFWMAEHHNMPSVASAATAVALANIGAGTSTIRIGSGGIMLPNHAPLIIAEQFGTLESLYPGRIDLGVGRAPGSDQATAYAIRRNLNADVNQFPRDVVELMAYFQPPQEMRVHAIPGEGLKIPVWILGSSLFGAQLAAMLGLPYAFASHFAPGHVMEAIHIYRSTFKPSAHLAKPYVMVGMSVFAAESDAEAAYLASSQQRVIVDFRSGRPGHLKPPVEGYMESLAPHERAMVNDFFSAAAIGSPDRVRSQIAAFLDRTGADELIVASSAYDHAKRIRSFEIVAEIMLHSQRSETPVTA